MHAIVIAGTHSGCGKTTVTLGILAALKKRGLRVQSFKAGPDFIDAGLHRIITGRPSRNLDAWMCGEDYVKNCFYKYSGDADISVIEGVMGLYDGEPSTSRLASVLGVPIILVVDAYGMAESAGAMTKGFRDWGLERGVNIKGIIFNRVGSERHYERIKDAVKDIVVMGYLPRNLDFEIPHRHLGLTVAEENPITDESIQRLADAVLEHIDVDTILSGIPPFNSPLSKGGRRGVDLSPSSIKIAVAYDKAFCFYYEDNLDLLRDAGAEVITFSLLSDSYVPKGIDAIYIGGGYPELYAEALSKNSLMRYSIKGWADAGRPLYAECGGLMYLSKGIWKIEDEKKKLWEMAGALPFETEMKEKRSQLGYREIILQDDCIIGKKGDRLRGHEFHYSTIAGSQQSAVSSQIYSLYDNGGKDLGDEGYRYKNTLASYIHIHFGSGPDTAVKFMNFIREH